MKKVKFKCKGCGWTKELPETWGDVVPRWCPTPTCEMSVKKSKGRKSFRTNPEMMEVSQVEEVKPPKAEVVVKTVSYQEKDHSSGKERRARKFEPTEQPAATEPATSSET